MRWTPQELILELDQDPARRILFVEGIRDLAFWRDLPLERGPGAVIYPISFLECEPGEGGERGRLIRAARFFQDRGWVTRIHFFADANGDRFLERPLPPAVTLTDGRDLESYALSPECLQHFYKIAFPERDGTGAALLQLLSKIARPIGVLRIASERASLRLPFSKTLADDRLKRFLTASDDAVGLDMNHLITALIQNAGQSLAIKDYVIRNYEDERTRLSTTSDHLIIHGRDTRRVLAWQFGVSINEIERLIYMSLALDRNRIREFPNVKDVENWLR